MDSVVNNTGVLVCVKYKNADFDTGGKAVVYLQLGVDCQLPTTVLFKLIFE